MGLIVANWFSTNGDILRSAPDCSLAYTSTGIQLSGKGVSGCAPYIGYRCIHADAPALNAIAARHVDLATHMPRASRRGERWVQAGAVREEPSGSRLPPNRQSGARDATLETCLLDFVRRTLYLFAGLGRQLRVPPPSTPHSL